MYAVRPRDVHFHIIKADTGAEFWPRLLKDKVAEKTNVKVDWDRYVDEDDGAGGFDTSDMGDAVRGVPAVVLHAMSGTARRCCVGLLLLRRLVWLLLG